MLVGTISREQRESEWKDAITELTKAAVIAYVMTHADPEDSYEQAVDELVPRVQAAAVAALHRTENATYDEQCRAIYDAVYRTAYLEYAKADAVLERELSADDLLNEMITEAAVEAPLHHEAVAFALENVDATDEQLKVLEDKCTYLAEAALDAAQGWKTEFEYGIAYAAAGAAVIKFRNEGQVVLDDWLRLEAEHTAACEAQTVAHNEWMRFQVRGLVNEEALANANAAYEAVLTATLRLNQC